MYKLYISDRTQQVSTILRLEDNACIPLVNANTDYANFKRDIEDGAELQDADGAVMSADVAKEFVRGLP